MFRDWANAVDARRSLIQQADLQSRLAVALLVALGAAAAGAAGALVVSTLPGHLATPVLAFGLSALALAPALHALVTRGDLFQPIVPIGLFFFLDFGHANAAG